MPNRIKKLDEYKVNEDFDIGSILSSVFPILGGAFADTIKGKITAALLEKIGLVEGSLLSTFFQEFVIEIPVGDYPRILSGDSDANYWAPKLSDFARRFIERKGIDTIAEKMGIKPTGLAFTYFRNIFLSKEGQDKLTAFFASVIGASDIGGEALKNLNPSEKSKLADIISKRMEKQGSVSSSQTQNRSSDGTNAWDVIQSFLGGLTTRPA